LGSAVSHRLEVVLLGALLLAAVLLPNGSSPGIILLGMAGGAGLSLNALGMVLVYRSNRLINFAQAQFGVTAAVIFAELAGRHQFLQWFGFVCPPCVTGTQGTVLQVLDFVLSFVVAVAVAGLLAWVTYALLVRRFARASRLVVTVATIGIAQLLAAVSGLVTSAFAGSSTDLTATAENGRILSNAVPPPANPSITVSGVIIHAPQLATIGIAVVACGLVAAYLRFSRGGVAVRGAAENPQRASTLGVDVDAVAGRVWLLAGLLSGVAACLTAMNVGVGQGGALSLSGLARILAVAVIARFVSLPVAVIAGLVLGVVDSIFGFALSTVPQLFEAVLVLLIGGALLLQREVRSRAAAEADTTWLAAREARPMPPSLRNVPSVRTSARVLQGVVAAVLIGFPLVTAPGQTVTASAVMIDAIIGLSLLVLTGWAGQISLGQFGIAAVGAYVAAVASASSGLNMLVALLLGAAAGGAAAVVIGIPALRLRGLLLAVMTLAFALAVSDVLLSDSYLGAFLPQALQRPALLGLDLGDETAFYYFTSIILVLVTVAVIGLRRSRIARALIACRENEAAAQSLGINITRARLAAFAISGAIAGLGGGLLAFDQRSVDPLAFAPEASVAIFLMVVIGGLGSIWGPITGAAYVGLITIVPIPFISFVATGGGVVALLLFAPGGLVQIGVQLRDSMLRRIALRQGIDAPGLLPDRGADGRAPAPIAALRVRGSEPYVPRRYRLRVRPGAEGGGG
jgi:branched-chain amino acid transport system permease protein